jgi:micrococcal nuclease
VQPPAQVASVSFVNAPLSARHGQATTLKAKTSPNTVCSIRVEYKSGPSHAQGLGAKTSDGVGNVSWTWIVGSNTTPGQWPIYVTCGSASGQTYITVS